MRMLSHFTALGHGNQAATMPIAHQQKVRIYPTVTGASVTVRKPILAIAITAPTIAVAVGLSAMYG